MTAEEAGKISVAALLAGTSYPLVYDAKSGNFIVEVEAPPRSSWPEPGHTFQIQVNAEGTDAEDDMLPAYVSLYLRVKEYEAPIITPVYPVDKEVIITATPTISWKVTDNDSGVDLSNMTAKLNGVRIPTESIQVQGNLYSFTPSRVMAGTSALEYTATDNDGNTATLQLSFVVDTPAPKITLTSPVGNFITNVAAAHIVGYVTAPAGIYPPFTVYITVNNVDQGPVVVNADGTFDKRIRLVNGENTIDVVAQDAIGAASHVTILAKCDQIKPEFISVDMTINPDLKTCTLLVDVIDKEE